MARTHVVLGILLQLVHAPGPVFEASWTVYLMSSLETTDLCQQRHICCN